MYTNNNELEDKIEEKKIPFTIATQKDKIPKKKIHMRSPSHTKKTL